MRKNISKAEIDGRIFESLTAIMPGGQDLIKHGTPITYPQWRPGIEISKIYSPTDKFGVQIVEYMAGPIKIARTFQPLCSDLGFPDTLPRSKWQARRLIAKHIQITVSMWHDEIDDFDGETYAWIGFPESVFSFSEMTRMTDTHFEYDADLMARRRKLFDACLMAALTV